AAARHSAIVKLLVERGANVRSRSKGDFTALLFAAQQGDVISGRILLESGADANETSKKGRVTALMLAAAGGHKDFASLLLDKGANPNSIEDGGRTALHFAALDGQRVELVKTLLTHGANPNVRTTRDSPRNLNQGISFKGATPLFFAASKGNAEVVRALI